ncbi:MAG: UDP-3-O-acyl-N-acetylglucosamine deacetylase [bacterium]
MNLQQTLKKEISYTGIAIHTGQRSQLHLRPAGSNEGITFIRSNLANKPKLKLGKGIKIETKRGTNISNDIFEIKTVEHLLAAIHGLGIDNITIEVSGPEIPIGDGSSKTFVDLICEAGIITLNTPRNYLLIKEYIKVSDGTASIMAEPDNCLNIEFLLKFEQSFIGEQKANFTEINSNFSVDIAPARTFGFYHEVQSLRNSGLALGGSLDNAIIIGEEGYSTNLRFPNELARHKILDLMGDLMILGRPLKAKIKCHQSGHKLNVELVKKIWEDLSSLPAASHVPNGTMASRRNEVKGENNA